MRYNKVALVAALACCCLEFFAVSSMAGSKVAWQAEGSVFRGPMGEVSVTSHGELANSATSVIGGETIFAARFSATSTLSPGTEVELWPVGADGASPDSSFGRNLWITSARTGGLVTFDIREIAHAWESGVLPNNGVMLVVAGEIIPGTSSPATVPGWSLPSITVHRLPATDNPLDGSNSQSGSRKPPTGRRGKVADGSEKR